MSLTIDLEGISKMKKKICILLTTLLMLAGCASTERFTNSSDEELELESNLNLDIEKIYAWVDEMPGAKTRFNITGKLVIPTSAGYDTEKMELTEIEIYQNNQLIYSIKPTVRNEKKNNTKGIRFSTIKGLTLNKNLDINKNIDIFFVLTEEGDKFNYLKKEVKVERVK